MHIIGTVYRFSFVVFLLPSLAAWNPVSARAGEDADNSYFRLIVANCYTCHSADSGAAVSIPKLDGLTAAEIKQLLIAYKTDQEQGTIMNRISKALTDGEIDGISAMFNQMAK